MTRSALLLIIVVILAACCLPSLAATQYTHTRITTLNARVSDGQVNSSGTVVFTAQDNVTLHTAVYLNSRNYSAPILGPQSNSFARGINDAGQITWNGAATGWVGNVYRDSTIVSQSAGALEGYPKAINALGQIAWCGLLGSGGYDAFVDQECVSAKLAPPKSQNAYAADLNDLGHLLWNTGGNAQVPGGVYLDTWRISALVPGVTGSMGIAVNNNDQVAWYGSLNSRCDVFRNGDNLSASVLGYYRAAGPRDINDVGQVLWSGHGTNTSDYTHVFLDQMDISAPVIGAQADARAIALTPDGHVMWSGGNPATHREDIYVDSFNLSLDALGGQNRKVFGLSISSAGHVLWTSTIPNTNITEVWLSTPVPEPSSLLALLTSGLALCGFARRRRS